MCRVDWSPATPRQIDAVDFDFRGAECTVLDHGIDAADFLDLAVVAEVKHARQLYRVDIDRQREVAYLDFRSGVYVRQVIVVVDTRRHGHCG